MKKNMMLVLITLAFIIISSGCVTSENGNVKINTKTTDDALEDDDALEEFELYYDCDHSVICYDRGIMASAFSCTYVEEIKECD